MVTMQTFFGQFSKLEVLHVNDVTSDEMIKSLTTSNPSLRELYLNDFHEDNDESRILSDKSIVSLSENCPNLEYISIPVYAKKGVLEKFVFSCPNLKHIELEGSVIEDEAFGQLSEHVRALEHLQMNYAPNISIEGIKRLVSSAECLKKLAVYWPGQGESGKLVKKEEFYKLLEEYPKVDIFIYFLVD